MRIGTLNVMSGGYGTNESPQIDASRFKRITDTIKAVGSDIMILTDTLRWAERFSPSDLCQHFNYDAAYAIQLNKPRCTPAGEVDARVGITMLTRGYKTRFETIRLATRNAIKAHVWYRNQSVLVYGLYLHHANTTMRIQQIQALLQDAATYTGNPVIIAGDFNAIRPWDMTLVLRFLRGSIGLLPAKYLSSSLLGQLHSVLDGTAIPLLGQSGFTDARPSDQRETTFHDLRYKSITPPSFIQRQLPLAVDQIWSRYCRLTDWRVHNTPAIQSASDHYPVSARLD